MTNDTLTPAQVRAKLHITNTTLERLRDKHVLNPVGFDETKNANLYSKANVEHFAKNHVEPLFDYQVKHRMGNIDQVHLSKIFRTWPYDEKTGKVDITNLKKVRIDGVRYTTTTDIAAFLGVKRNTVAKWMKEARVRRHKNGWNVQLVVTNFLTKLYNYGKLLDKSIYRFPMTLTDSCSDKNANRDFVKTTYLSASIVSKFTGLRSTYLQYLARGGIIKSYKTKVGKYRYDVSAIRYINNNQDVVVKALKTGGWKNITFQQTQNKLVGTSNIGRLVNRSNGTAWRLLHRDGYSPVVSPKGVKYTRYRVADVRRFAESRGVFL